MFSINFPFFFTLNLLLYANSAKKSFNYKNLEDEIQGLRNDFRIKFDEEKITDPRKYPSGEIMKRLKVIINRIDKNHNDILTVSELANWISAVDDYIGTVTVKQKWKENNYKNTKELNWNDYKVKNYGLVNIQAEFKRTFHEIDLRKDYRTWRLVDSNNDGNLTLEEFYYFCYPEKIPELGKLYQATQSVSSYDRDGDGFISYTEHTERYLQTNNISAERPSARDYHRIYFDRADEDGDSLLNFPEQVKYFDLDLPLVTATEKALSIVEFFDLNDDGLLRKEEVLNQYYDFAFSLVTSQGEILKKFRELNKFNCKLSCILQNGHEVTKNKNFYSL